MTDNHAIKVLEDKLNDIAILKGLRANSQEFNQWRRDTRFVLGKIFTNDGGRQTMEFDGLYNPGDLDLCSPSNLVKDRAYQRYLESAEVLLKSLIEEKKWDLSTATPDVASQISKADLPNEKSAETWYWKLYEKTLKVFIDVVLERICPKPK